MPSVLRLCGLLIPVLVPPILPLEGCRCRFGRTFGTVRFGGKRFGGTMFGGIMLGGMNVGGMRFGGIAFGGKPCPNVGGNGKGTCCCCGKGP